MLIIVTQMTF